MAIIELSMVTSAIVKMGIEGVLEKAKRREAVIRVLKEVGLNPDAPPPDFDGVYAYTLVQYGVDRPKPVLDFFRNEFIKEAFRESFEQRDPSVLNKEAESLLDWSQVGKELRLMDVDPRCEFASFTAVFNMLADRTRTVAEVKRDQKLKDVHEAVQGVVTRLEVLKELPRLRAEIERLRQERHEDLVTAVPEFLFTVPFMRNPDFVGRENDLERLHQALLGKQPVGIRPAGLTGMGGIGKTQLAVEYAYRYKDAYLSGVFWINAAEPLGQGFAQFGKRLRPAVVDRPLDEQIRAAADYLRAHPDALLILDNLADPAELNRPVSLDLIPAALPCRLLFTTRRRDLGRFQAIEVTVLPEAAAMQLLLRHSSRQPILSVAHLEHAAAQTICAILGYLPLALEIAGAHLGRWPEAPLAVYRQELLQRGALPVLDDPRGRLRQVDLPTRHEAAVEATLKSQWDDLRSDDARLLLRVASQLPEAALIPAARLGLLAGLSDQEEGFFGSPLTLAWQELQDASLVEELREDQVRLHPLVHAFAARQTSETDAFTFRQQCAAKLVAAYEDVAVLESHCACRGIDALQEDLMTALGLLTQTSEVSEYSRSLEDRLRLLLRLLQREAHNMRGWDRAQRPAFFAQQVHNRAAGLGLTYLVTSAATRLAQLGQPYLILRWRAGGESPELERTLTGHNSYVNAVAVIPDSCLVVSASQDHTLKIWDLHTGQAVRTLTGHEGPVTAVAVTPDGRCIISASSYGTIKVWDLQTGQAIRTIDGHPCPISDLAVTPDGHRAISASWNGILKVWDIKTGRAVRTFTCHSGEEVTAVAVTPDGHHVVSASLDGTLEVWDLNTGQVICSLASNLEWPTLVGVVVTPDGRSAISAFKDHTLKVWDLKTGQVVRTLANHVSDVFDLAVTPDGRHVIAATDSYTLKVWDLNTGQVVRTLAGHDSWVHGVAVTPDGHCAISASRDLTLRVWNLQTSQTVGILTGHVGRVRGMVVTPDGCRAISASWDSTLKVWDLQTGQAVRTLTGHEQPVNAVVITPDGHRAISASQDGTLKVWDLKTYRELYTLAGHWQDVNAVAITPDSHCAVSASDDYTLKVWDLQIGREVRTLTGHKERVYAVGISHGGQCAISAAYDDTIKVWDLQTGKIVRTMVNSKGRVLAVAVTSNGRYAISVSGDHTIKVWDLQTRREVHTLIGHDAWVNAIVINSIGDRAISTADDHTLRVWSLQTGQELATVALDRMLECVALAPDGVTILTGDGAGNVYCLRYMENVKSEG
jgi:WD40 repeat protein